MKNDKQLGLIILALGIAGILLTIQIPIKTFTDDPGPRVFPYMGSIILVISGLGLFLTRQKSTGDTEPFLTREGWKRAGIMTSLFIIYSLALKVVGFYIATPIMVFFFYRQIAGPEKTALLRGIIYSLVTFGAVYFVFSKVLNSFLPPGMIF
jgi:hypothetical protein